MAGPRILLVDQDASYLEILERKWIEEFRNQMELMVITEVAYLEEFFSVPQQLDLLIIHERLYDFAIEKHSIGHVFQLSEEEQGPGVTQDLHRIKLYKYTSIDDLFRQVMRGVNFDVPLSDQLGGGPTIISVYSPIGGMGKTTVAMGLCQSLATKGKRVLFIGTDSLQQFGYYMQSKAALSSETEKQIAAKISYIYSEIRLLIEHQDFDLLPILAKVRPNLRIGPDHYVSLINYIKEAEVYDYLILDLATDFSEMTTACFNLSDRIILVMGQDKQAVYKASRLLDNINCTDENRFTYLCNKYDRQEENHLTQLIGQGSALAKINIDPAIRDMSAAELGNVRGMQALSLMFI